LSVPELSRLLFQRSPISCCISLWALSSLKVLTGLSWYFLPAIALRKQASDHGSFACVAGSSAGSGRLFVLDTVCVPQLCISQTTSLWLSPFVRTYQKWRLLSWNCCGVASSIRIPVSYITGPLPYNTCKPIRH